MADLNALIAQGAQFQALPDPFVQYGRMQQLEQGQQANQLNRMKMEEAQAAAVERNALRGLNPTSPDYESQLFKVNPQLGIAYRKERTAADAQQATQQAQQAQALKTNLDNYRSFLVGVNDQPAYDAWRDSVTKNIPELGNMLPPAFSAEVKDSLLKRAEDVSRQLTAAPSFQTAAPGATVLKDGVPVYTATEKTPTSADATTMQALGFPLTPAGFTAFNNAKRMERLPAASGAGVSGGSPMGKAPSGYRYTPTGDLEPIPGGPSAAGLTAKEIQKREAVLPQTTQSLKTVNNTMSIIGQTVDRLLANPEGINGITGLVGGITPALTDKARLAKADLEQLKNLAFIQGLTELRAASKTGAGVGNVSNREGDRFENLKSSLDRSQSKADLEAALRRLKAQSEFTIQTMQEAFDDTYSYKSAAPVAPQGTGGFKYLGKESK
jgi:hypothetical protein